MYLILGMPEILSALSIFSRESAAPARLSSFLTAVLAAEPFTLLV